MSRIFLPLLCGLPLVIIPEHQAKDPWQLVYAWETENITAASVITPLLRQIVLGGASLTKRLHKIRSLTVAGAILAEDVISAVAATMPHATFINSYGASEIGGAAIHWTITGKPGSEKSEISRSFPNTRTYVLDEHMAPTAEDTVGEIYVSAPHLSRGYLHLPALTAERFVPNPFTDRLHDRLYRTGDLGRHTSDGQIEILGRIDNQVNIRGFRVELGEIESVIQSHKCVREAAVTALDADNDKRLVAYVVADSGANELVTDLQHYLRDRLPSHMVPSIFTMLDRLPLTSTGKVDRSALARPEPFRPKLNVEYEAPRNPGEAALAKIWAELLDLDHVGIHDDFLELGGHSLIAVQIISRIRDQFDRELPVRLILERPTIAEFAPEIIRDNNRSH